MPECVFCRIAAGAEPASVVHEDESDLVVMDLFPVSKGHALVIPRRHAGGVNDLTPAEGARLFDTARRVIRAQRAAAWGLSGIHLLLNDGRGANQQVPHVHIHLIPRYRGDAARALLRLLRHLTGRLGAPADRAALDARARELAALLDVAGEAAPGG
ncbi:MAG TPA: HIT family protein [Gammaproteobacteria bacterium]|nr:HIT family protein [Gammaproteobacteria bacterium]